MTPIRPSGSSGERILAQLPALVAAEDPDRIAIESSSGETWTYGELAGAAERVAGLLAERGIGAGHRVAICAPKSPATVGAIFGILLSGAAYVPIDPDGPPGRARLIADDCDVTAVIADEAKIGRLAAAGLKLDVQGQARLGPLVVASRHRSDPRDSDPSLAYVLYTSGSTGSPKGVMIAESSAMSFVDWCRDTLRLSSDDRFSSHAPFHFDLSIFDLFVCFSSGGTLVLISSLLAKLPRHLARYVSEQRITVWYSTPSALTLFHTSGQLQQQDLSSIRYVLFAGEVFPIKHLRAVRNTLTQARFFNLYGPTETNVCTYYELPPSISPDRDRPMPIGTACSHVSTAVIGATGEPVEPGGEGELVIAGESLMLGYWGRSEATEGCWRYDSEGTRWYRTGDIVRENPGGQLEFIGRRDRMIKRRGYRVELGEVEAALYRHPAVLGAAVVLVEDDREHLMVAFLEGRSLQAGELKPFLGQHLPSYMIPDRFVLVDKLPRTTTDKIDFQSLMTRESAHGEQVT